MRHTHQRTQFDLADNRRITFYAAVWNAETTIYTRTGSYRERLLPGMFSASLKDPSTEVVATVDHDAAKLLAKRSAGELVLSEDPHGLFASLWLPETPLGETVLAGVKDGTITGASVGWNNGQRRTANNVTEWVNGELFDVCVVLNGEPAYPQTEVNLRNRAFVNSLFARARLAKFKVSTLHNIK